MSHPNYLQWQQDWPLFIKIPFGTWKRDQHYNWLERGLTPEKVAVLYSSGYVYHNTNLEVSQHIGDRLGEMDIKQLTSLVNLLNNRVQTLATSKQEFNDRKCKKSTLPEKQRGLIRRFLNANSWVQEDFYKFRDNVLNTPEEPTE